MTERKYRTPGEQVDALVGSLWHELRGIKLLLDTGVISLSTYTKQRNSLKLELRMLRIIPRGLGHDQLVHVLDIHDVWKEDRSEL